MQETWYVLEDGSVADPADVVPTDGNLMMHKDGVLVAMRGDVPSTRGVDADEERAKVKPAPERAEGRTTREALPEKPKRGYKTRSIKAD